MKNTRTKRINKKFKNNHPIVTVICHKMKKRKK